MRPGVAHRASTCGRRERRIQRDGARLRRGRRGTGTGVLLVVARTWSGKQESLWFTSFFAAFLAAGGGAGSASEGRVVRVVVDTADDDVEAPVPWSNRRSSRKSAGFVICGQGKPMLAK